MVEAGPPEAEIPVVRVPQAVMDLLMAALTPFTPPVVEQAARYRTPQLLAEIPTVKAILSSSGSAWRRWKAKNVVLNWTLRAAERQLIVTLQSVLIILLIFPKQLQYVDDAVSESITKGLQAWPILNKTPEEILQSTKERIVKCLRPWYSWLKSVAGDGGHRIKTWTETFEMALSILSKYLANFEELMYELETEFSNPRAVRGSGRFWRRHRSGPLGAAARMAVSAACLWTGLLFVALSRIPLVGRLFQREHGPPTPTPLSPVSSTNTVVPEEEEEDSS